MGAWCTFWRHVWFRPRGLFQCSFLLRIRWVSNALTGLVGAGDGISFQSRSLLLTAVLCGCSRSAG